MAIKVFRVAHLKNQSPELQRKYAKASSSFFVCRYFLFHPILAFEQGISRLGTSSPSKRASLARPDRPPSYYFYWYRGTPLQFWWSPQFLRKANKTTCQQACNRESRSLAWELDWLLIGQRSCERTRLYARGGGGSRWPDTGKWLVFCFHESQKKSWSCTE